MALDEGVNGMFYLSALTLICGIFSLAIRFCYRSKCKTCECCGFKITRDIETEKEEDLSIMQTNKSNDKITA
jgi:hypothetical protein